jgi:uncharacterized membrane protein YfcA
MSLFTRVSDFFRQLWQWSIWHPTAIDPEEWKFRNLMRVYLPTYDFLAVLAGIWAAMFGSPILHRLFPEDFVVDVLGIALAAIAMVCLAGVAFPRLARVETLGKVLLVGLLSSYAGAIVIFNANGDISSWFVAFVVLMVLPLPLYRLSMLGEEKKERREESETE